MTKRRVAVGRQRGSVLVIGLMVLLVMTVLGVGLMRSTSMQERMGGNLQDRNRAFEAAEAALAVGESWVASNTIPFAPLQRGVFTENGRQGDYRGLFDNTVSLDDVAEGGVEITRDPDGTGPFEPIAEIPGLAEQPTFSIQLVSSVCAGNESVAMFRVVARGWGSSEDTSVTLVSELTHRTSCGAGGGSGSFTMGSNVGPVI